MSSLRLVEFCRVLCKLVTKSCFGERFCLEDDEDSVVCEVARVCVGQARYRTELRGAVPAGNWVMLDGVDATISKSATITHAVLTAATVRMR